jgi:hypothetical protein
MRISRTLPRPMNDQKRIILIAALALSPTLLLVADWLLR